MPLDSELADADRRIRNGSSIGETLSDMGIETSKQDDHWCHWPAGEYFASLTGNTVSPTTQLSLRLYTLRTRIQERPIDYAVIAEAYHPDHFGVTVGSSPCDPGLEEQPLRSAALLTLRQILDRGL